MSFGSKDKSGAQMVSLQQEQAAEARNLENERNARIQQGANAIRGLFEGAPVMGQRQVQRTRQVKNPGFVAPQAQAYSGGGSDHMTSLEGRQGGSYQNLGGHDSMTSIWVPDAPAAAGASGAPGAAASGPEFLDETYSDTETYDTGQRSGGFGDAFFKDYGDRMFNYMNSQIGDQSNEAQRDLLFALDNAGLMGSTEVDRGLGKWQKQTDAARTDARSKSDQAAGDLRTNVDAQRNQLLSQLYATEGSPEVAGLAQAASNTLKSMPAPTPATSIGFDFGTIGQKNYQSGYKSGQDAYWNNRNAPQTTSPNKSSGGYG